MTRYFSRSYLNQDKKLKKLDDILQRNTLDVFLIQEPTV